MSHRRREKDARRQLQARPATGNGRPSYEANTPLILEEIPVPPAVVAAMLNGHNDHLRSYRLGECSVIVTREFGKWHLSIAHPRRYPTWDEVAAARYRVLPDGIVVAMLLPPKADYINIHERCFQLCEIDDPDPRLSVAPSLAGDTEDRA